MWLHAWLIKNPEHITSALAQSVAWPACAPRHSCSYKLEYIHIKHTRTPVAYVVKYHMVMHMIRDYPANDSCENPEQDGAPTKLPTLMPLDKNSQKREKVHMHVMYLRRHLPCLHAMLQHHQVV
jgi:hypothetical protein